MRRDERMQALRRDYDRRRLNDIKELADAGISVEFRSNLFRALEKRFIVASSARTGSHLLCERLLNYDLKVGESLLQNQILRKCAKTPVCDLEAYCTALLAKDAPRGAFGTKGFTKLLAPLILAGEFPRFCQEWNFIHLIRLDTLKQAISYVIAEQTSSWRSYKAPAKTLGDGDFDAARIARAKTALERRNKQWNDTFVLFDIEPLRLTYEQLAADPDAAVAQVARFIGVESWARPRPTTPKLEAQATELNARWEDMFLNLPRDGGGGADHACDRIGPS